MACIAANQGKHPVKRLCEVVSVSESGYYQSRRKPPKEASKTNEAVLHLIYAILREDAENAHYGVRRLYLALVLRYGYHGSESTVRRICRDNGLTIRKARRGPNGITAADAKAQKAENLIKQDFTADHPNEKWLTDIKEVPCSDGNLYLCGVLDCFDGALVGHQMESHMRAKLCISAYEKACTKHNAGTKHSAISMIVHSDRGR